MTPANTPTQTRNGLEPLGWPYSPLQSSTEFAETWKRHFGAGIRLGEIRQGGAWMPFMRVRQLRPLSLSCRFDFLPSERGFIRGGERRLLPLVQLSPPMSLQAGNLRGGFGIEAGREVNLPVTVTEALAAEGGWDVLQLPVPTRDALAWKDAASASGLLPIVRRSGRQFYANRDFRGWDALLSASSRNFRKNVARLDSALHNSNAFVQVFAGSELDKGLDLFEECARESWKSGGTRDVPVRLALTAVQRAFHRDVAGLPRHEVFVAALMVDGEVAGAQSWFRTGSTLTAGLTFHKERFKSLSPGHALLQSILRRMEGVTSVDFNATAPWLEAYTDSAAEFSTLIATRPTPLGRALNLLALRRDPGYSG